VCGSNPVRQGTRRTIPSPLFAMPYGNHMANLHTKWRPRAQRVEQLVLGVGLTLLGIFVTTQIYRVVASRSAIAHFKANTPVARNPTVELDPVAGSPVDFTLWDNKRIAAYKQSLVQKRDLPLAILRIPSIHLEVPIFDGTDELTLNRGVGRIEGTAQIRQAGNMGIAGHRDGFFRGLKDIQPGDPIELVLSDKTEKYVVDRAQVVTPDDVQVLAPTATPTLTLVTCFPFYYVGSAPQRFIVTASMKNF
jgi:sortase A